ncbi:MAG: hypothetical protein WA085_12620 [Sphingobium sp.]
MSVVTRPPKKPTAKQQRAIQLQQAIIDDVRAGLLSIPQIAEKHNVDYHKAYRISKTLGGGGDLHGEVVGKVQNEVAALRIADNINDSVVVTENAQIVLMMMREHSQSVMRARNVAALLMDELESTIRNREAIEEDIEVKCADDQSPLRRNRMMAAVSLPTNTKTLADLSGALKTLIGLEREMFNIGQAGSGEGDKTLEDYVLSLPAVN